MPRPAFNAALQPRRTRSIDFSEDHVGAVGWKRLLAGVSLRLAQFLQHSRACARWNISSARRRRIRLTDPSAMSLVAQAHTGECLLPGNPFDRDVVARAGPTLLHWLPTVELIEGFEKSLENRRIVNLPDGRSNTQVRMVDSNRRRALRRVERESWLPAAPGHSQSAQGKDDDPAARHWHRYHARCEQCHRSVASRP